ncbi:DUF551 domain-containing protein [Escherichia coli]|nr:DUF551 domain-containing protein [Escherichia coli]
MTTFTDKELIKEIKERIGSLDVRDNIERRAYEIALASLEAEPVGEFYEYKPGDWYQRSIGDKAPKWVPLYATPPVPELQADVAQAIENLKQKLVECNRYNYCADAVKGVEDACLAAMRHGPEPVSQTYKLNELAGNSPVTPDGWISCSERMPAQDDWILIYSKHGEYMAGQVQGEYVELSDGTLSWLGNVLFWMPLPEPPQEVK